MNQQRLYRSALGLSLAAAGIALADPDEITPGPAPAAIAPAAAPSANMAVLRDTVASKGTVRISRLLNAEVYDPAAKDVGKIKDIVFDGTYTRIDYTVIENGIVGINQKLLALPYRALTLGGPADDHVYAQVPLDVVQKAPGFDDTKWPTEASSEYYSSLDAYYNTQLNAALSESRQPDQAEKARVAAGVVQPATLMWSRRATDLIGRDVISPTGERLGSIRDLVIDTKTGELRYAALVHGGAVPGATYYAVPLSSFHLNPDSKKLVLDLSSDQLKAIPGFDKDHWPAGADPRWITPAGKGDIVK
jgi:sporulation protein YlmC with PRC-barrel domain